MKKKIALLLVIVMVFCSINNTNYSYAASSGVTEKGDAYINELIQDMTLEQKIGQMLQPDTRSITPEEVAQYNIGSILSGGGAKPNDGNTYEEWAERADSYHSNALNNSSTKSITGTGYGIPLLYGVDAVHGHNNVYGATILPHNLGLAAANDADLMFRAGEMVTSEVIATGINWDFTPIVGTPHNERWGRTHESFGSDYNRASVLGTKMVEGMQSTKRLAATSKHFLGEGITTNGVNQGDAVMAEQDYNALINADMNNPLVKELLDPYVKAIDSGVMTIMITYNSINGVRCHGNKDVITTLLKQKLGFNGIVISDYNGLDQISGTGIETYKDKAIACVNAGVDVLMCDGSENGERKWVTLLKVLKEGCAENRITIDRINDAVYRILKVKDRMGLLANPELSYSSTADKALFGSAEHRAIAREAVRKSLVLLKNDKLNDTQTIMEMIGSSKNLVVAGSAADDIGKQCGGWTISWQGSTGNITKGTTIYKGILDALVSKGGTAKLAANGYFEGDTDAVIIAVGENPYAESSGDRSEDELILNSEDQQTIATVKADHPNTPIVLVLISGRGLGIADYVLDPQIKGIVEAWQPGTEGEGVADVLVGNNEFTGTNPIIWTWYPQDINNKYTDSSKVLYPVGYGLKKSQVTPVMTAPADPKIVNLGTTAGKLEAENFISKHSGIVTENNGTSIGYLSEGRDISYKLQVPEQANYTLTINAATQNDNITTSFDLYLDGTKIYSTANPLPSTGGWAAWKEVELPGSVSLKSGSHILKMVAHSKDWNIDYFKFAKSGDYVEPEKPVVEDNIGTGALIKTGAVSVTMSSSENSGSMGWYKSTYKITNKVSAKDNLDLRVQDTKPMTTIAIDQTKEYQSFLGMGTSVEESTIYNLMKMNEADRKAFIKKLVDPVNGSGMTLFRLTIGTPDFTAQNFYTYYDVPNAQLLDQPDWVNGFSIQKDRDYHIIEIVKEIQAAASECGVADQIKFFASSWTPPGWMKEKTSNSDSYSNNSLLLKGGKLSGSHISDLAKYYVRYIEEYKKEGIPIYAITLQNEPMLEIDYPSCLISAEQEAALGTAIKAELQNSTILTEEEKNVKLWAFDHNPGDLNDYMNKVYTNSSAIDGAAVHDYGGELSNMTTLYNNYENKSIHLTERSVWGTYGMDRIVQYFRNYCVSYNAWVTMLDSNISTHQWVGTPDPTAFVQNANNANEYWSTPEVYLMSQFSKYIRPGYLRIDSNYGSSSTITNVVFKNPVTKEIVMVAVNQTDQNQNFKVIMDDTQFNASLPAGNVATYRWLAGDAKVNTLEISNTIQADQCISYTNLVVNEDHTLGNLTSNATADYIVNVPKAGTYNIALNVVSGNDESRKICFTQDNKELGFTVLRSPAWDPTTYRQVQIQVTLKAGIQKLTLSVPGGYVNIKDLTFREVMNAYAVPGYIDAVNYANAEGVLVEGGNVGYFETASNWSFLDNITYRLNVQKAGKYVLSAVVATNNSQGKCWYDLFDQDGVKYTDDTKLHEFVFDSTGGWDKYETRTVNMLFDLKAGINTIKFTTMPDGGFNIKSLSFGSYINVSSDTLTEGSLKDKTLDITLTGGVFNNPFDAEGVTIDELMPGVNYTVERIDDTKARITFTSEASEDFDVDTNIIVKVAADQIGDTGYTLEAMAVIKAVNDDESLIEIPPVEYGAGQFTVDIVGGSFKNNVADFITLSDNLAKYIAVTGSSIEVQPSKITVHYTFQMTNFEDIQGSIIIAAGGYSQGTVSLEKALVLKGTTQLPDPILVSDQTVTALPESTSYRRQGTLGEGNSKGDYVDYYLRIATPGNYVISYNIKSSQGIINGLKLSGGEGLKTDNLSSVSFSNFWSNKYGYRQAIALNAGDQTLRFEINNAGFSLSDLTIQKQPEAILVSDTATKISADKLFNGSKDKGWGIETKNDQLNVGCNSAGAYQDYLVNVVEDGKYKVKINYATAMSGTKAQIFTVNRVSGSAIETTLGQIELASSNGWDNFGDSQDVEIQLKAGQQVLRIYDLVDGYNYRNFTLTYQGKSDKGVLTADNFNYNLMNSTYDKAEHAAIVNAKDNVKDSVGVITIMYAKLINNEPVEAAISNAPIHAGTYQVIATIAESSLYQSATFTLGNMVISPRAVSGGSITILPITQNSSTVLLQKTVSFQSAEILAGDVVNAVGNLTFPATNEVGTFEGATAEITGLTNSDYVLEAPLQLSNQSYTVIAGNPSDSQASINSVTATNGVILVVLDKVPTSTPTVNDFTAIASINSVSGTSLSLTDFTWEEATKTASIRFNSIVKVAINQTVVVSVSYNEGTAVTAESFTVSALTIPEKVAVTGITLSSNNLSRSAYGPTITLTATLAPINATNKEVQWFSNNTAVATVENGVVTPLNAGTATITVMSMDNNMTASCLVTVYSSTPEPTSIQTPTPSPTPQPIEKAELGIDGSLNVSLNLSANKDKDSKEAIILPISNDILGQLSKKEVERVNISVNVPDTSSGLILTKEALQLVKEAGKDITLSIKDKDGKEKYSWSFDGQNNGNSDKEISDVNLSLEVSQTSDYKDIDGNLGESNGLVITFAHSGELPSTATVRIYVGDRDGMKEGQKVYLYYFNHETNKLETLPYSSGYTVDQDGYVTAQIVHCSDYVVLTQKATTKQLTSLVNQIRVDLSTKTLYLGKTKKSTATVKLNLPSTLELVDSLSDKTSSEGIGGVTVTYTSSNKKVITVDRSGKITAAGKGKATLTAKITLYSGKVRIVKIKVTVKE